MNNTSGDISERIPLIDLSVDIYYFSYIFKSLYICRVNPTIVLKLPLSIPEMEHGAEMLKALAHPMRLAIVALISENKTCTVSHIQEVLGLEQAVVSQQLSVLKSRNVLVCEREGKNSVYSLKYACVSTIVNCLNQCKLQE